MQDFMQNVIYSVEQSNYMSYDNQRIRSPYERTAPAVLNKRYIIKIVSNATDNETQLLSLVSQEDPTAMRRIYSSYVRYLSAVCSRYIPNDDDVKDVLQESFVKIFSRIKEFEYRGEGSLKGWLTRITVNESLRFLKLQRRIEFVELPEQDYILDDKEPDVDSIPTGILLEMIRNLPDGYRTIFNLYVIEGKSHKEIAALLGIKASTSASQLHHAKSVLATKIRKYKL